MLILIIIDVQYLQKAVLSFEKGSNHQNHSSSGSHHKISPQQNLPPSHTHTHTHTHTHILLLFGKPCIPKNHIFQRVKGAIIHNLFDTIFDTKTNISTLFYLH